MAAALPTFPEFDVTHTSTQAARWKKWQSRFRNLLVAMNVTDKKRKRALLLHNAGEPTNEKFDTLPDTTPGEGEDTFEKAIQALKNYFTPRQNREYEIYVSVRPSKSQTRLRQLAVTLQTSTMRSRHRLFKVVVPTSLAQKRSRTLRTFLTELLDDERAMELSQKQAANIEESQTVNTFPIYTFKYNCIWVLFLMAPFPSMTMWTM